MANGSAPATPAPGATPAVKAKASEPPPRPKEAMRSPREDLSLTDRVFLAIENPVLRRELLTALRSHKSFVLQFFYLAILGVIAFVVYSRRRA